MVSMTEIFGHLSHESKDFFAEKSDDAPPHIGALLSDQKPRTKGHALTSAPFSLRDSGRKKSLICLSEISKKYR